MKTLYTTVLEIESQRLQNLKLKNTPLEKLQKDWLQIGYKYWGPNPTPPPAASPTPTPHMAVQLQMLGVTKGVTIPLVADSQH